MFAASTILYKMIVCLSESRGGLHLGNLFLATVDSAIKDCIKKFSWSTQHKSTYKIVQQFKSIKLMHNTLS